MPRRRVISINAKSAVPKYRQIIDSVQKSIEKRHLKKGDKVHYIPYPNCGINEMENGIFKSVHPQTMAPMVVFHCGNDWENYEDYTAQSCTYTQLGEGWVGL